MTFSFFSLVYMVDLNLYCFIIKNLTIRIIKIIVWLYYTLAIRYDISTMYIGYVYIYDAALLYNFFNCSKICEKYKERLKFQFYNLLFLQS